GARSAGRWARTRELLYTGPIGSRIGFAQLRCEHPAIADPTVDLTRVRASQRAAATGLAKLASSQGRADPGGLGRLAAIGPAQLDAGSLELLDQRSGAGI